MDMDDLIDPKGIIADLKAKSKKQALQELAIDYEFALGLLEQYDQ